MVSRDEQRLRVLERLVPHLLETGLAETSLRQLAAVAGVSDRMLLYYFEDKTDVLSATLERIAASLAGELAAAIPEGPLPPTELIPRASAIVLAPQTRPYMRLWVEVVAAAARREEPFAAIAGQIVSGFLGWIGARLAPMDSADREAVAAAILAIIDGMALLEICAGADLTARAAGSLGALLRISASK